MPTVTVSGTGTTTTATYTSNQSAPYANTLALAISNALGSGATSFPYTSGATAPGGPNGVTVITTTPTTSVAIPTTNIATVITSAGPVSITGGAAGESVVAGSGGLTYTNITPSGTAIDYIVAGDGANLISTSTTGTGNYSVNTGSGNDTISINGNSVVNAGTGFNTISVTGGSSLIYSEGNDSIVGSTVVGGGGTDTINLGSGQATINPGTSNLFIFGSSTSTNPIHVLAGTGSDTISVGSGGGDVVAGTGGNSILIGGAGGLGSAITHLHGTFNGDQIYAIGGGTVFATAGSGNETISGAGANLNGFTIPGSTANNVFSAGVGNDTLIAGTGQNGLPGGNDTLIGGSGTALMVSGTGHDTFSFTFGSGGTDTITGFKAGDMLQLNNYGIATLPTMLSGSNTLISLSDGTQITLTGVTALNSSQVALK